MDYKEKYENGVECIQEILGGAGDSIKVSILRKRLQPFFPELRESEDEKIRKELCDFLRDNMLHQDAQYFISWLEKQGKFDNSLYIRFGDIPANEKSKIYRGEQEIGSENSVSVYPAFEDKEGNIILGLNLPITKTSLHTQQHLLEYESRPCYLVTGDYVGKGTDGEPLIKNVRIIKEIKHYRMKQDKENNTYIINNTPNCGISVYNEELKESEDEKIRKCVKYAVDKLFLKEKIVCDVHKEDVLAWLEKQKDYIKFPNSTYTSNKDVNEFADKYSHDIWEKLMNNFKKIENYHIGCNDVSDIVLNAIINTYIWLEGQGDKKHIFNADDWYVSEVDGKIHNAKFIEKQDGEKPADKIEPKFKVGDWIIFNGLILHIDEVVNGYYRTTSKGDDIHNSYDWDIDNAARLWTIQDAKDGDVLTNGEFIVIFKQIVEPKYRQHIEAYIGLDLGGNIQITSESWSLGIDKAMPATKEQRDLLFQKMKEEGYEWDSEKKELKKVEPKKLDADKVIEWLDKQACLGWLEDIEVEKVIEQFKKDFRL